MTPQSGNQVSTSFGNSGLCWTVFTQNRDTAVPAEGNGNLQTLICVLVARPRRCLTLSNPGPWQNWMAACLGYTLRMGTLFPGWPVRVNDTHTRRRKRLWRKVLTGRNKRILQCWKLRFSVPTKLIINNSVNFQNVLTVVDWWAVTFGTVMRGLGGAAAHSGLTTQLLQHHSALFLVNFV